MSHSLIEVLIPWSVVVVIDLCVLWFFVKTGNGKNSSSPVDTTDKMLYNQRNRKG